MKISNLFPKQIFSNPISKTTQNGIITQEHARQNQNQDTVSISNEAKNLANQKFPLEAYSLPQWFGNYIPQESVIPTMKVGLSSSSGIQLNSQQYPSGSNNDELREYNDKLLDFLQGELVKHGIDDTNDYYSLLKDDKLNEDIHQSVRNRMFEDSRFLDLTRKLGIEL